MRQLICAACIALFLGGIASGGDFRVVGQDVDWSPGGQASSHYVLAIENVTKTTDKLGGWQLSLQAVPAPGATGTLQFASLAKPSNYVLGDAATGITFPFFSPPSGTTGVVFDDVFPAVTVAEVGQNLLELEIVSNNAQGRFDILMLPGEVGSCWISEDVQIREFYGAPLAGPPVPIGSITVSSVPEPANGVLVLSAIAAGIVGYCARRKRISASSVRDSALAT